MTEDELAEYYRTHPAEARRAGIAAAPAPQAPSAVLATSEDKQLEAEVEAGITAFLAQDGWRGLKTDPVSDKSRGKGFGELGMADYLYIRYNPTSVAFGDPGEAHLRAEAEVLWIEHKRPHGSRIAQNQHDWHKIERARGALTLKAGEDFTPTVEAFREWYAASGLTRRPRWW